ncbi:phosphate transporter permease subunit PtsA, partial [Burkholderia sp. TJI49]
MNFPGPDGAALEAMRMRLQRKRKVTNAIALTASLGAMAF